MDTIRRQGRDNYTDVIGGLAAIAPPSQRLLPSGGNIAFVDGHVAWRPFDKMAVHTSGTPTFLW